MTALASTQLLFIDTNVWLYAPITGQDPTKAQKARTLVARNNTIIVSTQVINEVCVNLIKREHFTAAQTRDVINDFYAVYSVVELRQSMFVAATTLREQFTLSYWDSLIVASALAGGASVLYSEDMHNGLLVDQRLTIMNPFT